MSRYCDLCDLTIPDEKIEAHWEDDISHEEMSDWAEKVGLRGESDRPTNPTTKEN